MKLRQNCNKQEVIHYVLRFINLLILFEKKNCRNNGKNVSLYLFIKRVIKLTVVVVQGYHFYQVRTKPNAIFLSQKFTPYIDEIIWDHLSMIVYTAFVILKKICEYNWTVHEILQTSRPITQSEEKYYTVSSLNLVHL